MSLMIDQKDRQLMLQSAREAIVAHIKGRPAQWPEHSSAGGQNYGAFVTIHKKSAHGRRLLRGCIGRIRADEPLDQVIRTMAVAAAFEDPRFPPLVEKELESIDLEISVMSPFESCSPEDISPGLHGVYLIQGHFSAVFLPQVATEQGWSRTELLDQLCMKAGIPAGSHTKPDTKLFRFTATVFGELEV